MIVGKRQIDNTELLKHCATAEEFIQFSDSLVPSEFQHVPAIIDNQRYLCCLLLRRSKQVSWQHKKEIVSEVMKGISIVGFTDEIIDAELVFTVANRDMVEKYRKKVERIGT